VSKTPYDTVTLHCLSGTGNTYRVTEWIVEEARAVGIPTQVHAVHRGATPDVPTEGRRLVGLLSPTHGFTAPWGAIRYALSVPGVRGADVFCVATRAGWYVGPWLLPGLEGTAPWVLALILLARGARPVGIMGVDMPSNWTALHWGMSRPHVATILERARPRVAGFADAMLRGHRRVRGWPALAAGLLLLPGSLAYLALGHLLLGKFFFADERCTSCGRCARHCPFDAVLMVGEAPPLPYWTYRCESCMRCMNVCPHDAVQATWPGAVGVYFLTAVPVGAAAVAALQASGAGGTLLDVTVQYVFSLLAVAAAYAAVWLLARLRPMAWLLGHTTPTRLYRRYREPGTDLRRI
jgi:Pyruvate/2-oxoacid:ferredoxin oxidoreductase delta subunit